MERKYFLMGWNSTKNCYDKLEEAITACKKYNKKVKHKRCVYSGIPKGENIYMNPKLEWEDK